MARRSSAQLRKEIEGYLYWPGGDGGGGSRRGSGIESAVVKPHARTSPRCTKCAQFHTTAEHERHAGSTPVKRGGGVKAKAKKVDARPRTRAKAKQADVGPGAKARATQETRNEREERDQLLVEMLARKLLDTAVRTAPASDRYGPHKVFVSRLWDRIGGDLRMTLPQFKAWLITLNRTEAADLARADLVGAMNPRDVERSEINDHGATFHFVLDRDARWR